MRGRFLLLFPCLLLLAGCGGSSVAPVSGTVTLDGKPLANATVVFQPDGGGKEPGPASSGVTDANGRYTLRVVTGSTDGAVVGKHKVSITAYEGDVEGQSSAPGKGDKVFAKALVPVEYNAQTTLTFEVPSGGTDKADFVLKAAPAKGK